MKKYRSFIGLILFCFVFLAFISGSVARSEEPIIRPTHTVKVYGYVKDTNGHAISGAKVTYKYNSFETGFSVSTTTKSSGYYSLSITTTLYVSASLTVSKVGYHGKTISVYTKGNHYINLNLQGYVFCYGYVKDTSGKPISGATVTFTNGHTNYKSVSTNSKGYYSLRYNINLEPNQKYYLKATKFMYLSQSRTVSKLGYNSISFGLAHVPSSEFYLKVAALDYFPNLVGNAVSVKVDLYSTTYGLNYHFAILSFQIRFDGGSGYIYLTSSSTYWTCLSHSYTLENKQTKEIQPLDLTTVTINYDSTSLHYDSNGYDFTNYVVRLDLKFKLKYDPSVNDFGIMFSIINRDNTNNIIGLQKGNIVENSDCTIEFNENQQFLTDYYYAAWDYSIKNLLDEKVQYVDLFNLEADIYAIITAPFDFADHPNPYFIFHL